MRTLTAKFEWMTAPKQPVRIAGQPHFGGEKKKVELRGERNEWNGFAGYCSKGSTVDQTRLFSRGIAWIEIGVEKKDLFRKKKKKNILLPLSERPAVTQLKDQKKKKTGEGY